MAWCDEVQCPICGKMFCPASQHSLTDGYRNFVAKKQEENLKMFAISKNAKKQKGQEKERNTEKRERERRSILQWQLNPL